AFEFSSTSDPEGRKTRLTQLLANERFNPEEVATGLFCVLEVARARCGQLIVRTPTGILSLDFTDGKAVPVVHGRQELAIRQLGRLKGTHYLLRLPLTPPGNVRPSASEPTSEERMPNIEIVLAFENAEKQESVPAALQSAITAVEAHLQKMRETVG